MRVKYGEASDINESMTWGIHDCLLSNGILSPPGESGLDKHLSQGQLLYVDNTYIHIDTCLSNIMLRAHGHGLVIVLLSKYKTYKNVRNDNYRI